MPITSAPVDAASAATTELSTPPDHPTTMRHSPAGRGKSTGWRLGMTAVSRMVPPLHARAHCANHRPNAE